MMHRQELALQAKSRRVLIEHPGETKAAQNFKMAG
jgi:hypothetical protein